jgi:hypothetical protein
VIMCDVADGRYARRPTHLLLGLMWITARVCHSATRRASSRLRQSLGVQIVMPCCCPTRFGRCRLGGVHQGA